MSFIFEIIIVPFPIPFPPSKQSRAGPLALFQIHGIFLHKKYVFFLNPLSPLVISFFFLSKEILKWQWKGKEYQDGRIS